MKPLDLAKYAQTIVSTVNDPIIITNTKGLIIYWNKGAQELFGYTQEEVLGKKLEFLSPGIDVARLEEARTRILNGEDYVGEWGGQKKDGTAVCVEARATVLKDSNGTTIGILGISKDVTDKKNAEKALKESEELYHRMVEVAPLPIGIHQKGILVYANKAGAQLLGGKSPADIIGRSVFDFVHPDYIEIVIERARRAQIEKKELDVLEEKFITLDGRVIDVEVVAGPIVFEGENSVQVVIRDITEEKELRRRKDEFISVASHELKTPLTSLKGYVQLLQQKIERLEDKKTTDLMKRTNDQVTKLMTLVTELLDTARIQEGKMVLHKEFFPVDDLIEEVVSSVKDTGVHHQFIVKGVKGIDVNADRGRIGQILTNLLNNAVQYSPLADKVVVETKKVNGTLIISIQDFGIGIPEQEANKIFERFYQVTNPTLVTARTLGLGLYISSEIAHKHGGELWVDSEHGQGSTFYLSLPVS